MANCIFCGTELRKAARSKEHIIPMWLLSFTGDPHRKIRIEFDPDTGADIIRPASTFHFPACPNCNKRYGEGLEAKAHRTVVALSRRRCLSVSDCYCLLDWLDKVRVGLWLGYHALHKDIFEPRFRIDGRLGKKDRVAIVSVDPNDQFKGFSVGGCDNNVFRTAQTGVYLRINNIRILTVSSDVLIGRLAGLPYPKQSFVSQSDGRAFATMSAGDHRLKQDWTPFVMPGAITIAQPILTLSPEIPEVTNMYLDTAVLRHSKDELRSLRVMLGGVAWPLQLIANVDGPFRYCPNKREIIRFGTATNNSDGGFMHALYAIFLKYVIEREPQIMLGRDGTKFRAALTNYLYVQKLLQILMRLEQLGVQSPDPKLKDDLIDEIHRFSRILEEQEAHAHGTLEPGHEKPWPPSQSSTVKQEI